MDTIKCDWCDDDSIMEDTYLIDGDILCINCIKCFMTKSDWFKEKCQNLVKES